MTENESKLFTQETPNLIRGVVKFLISEINTLRTEAGLPALTKANVISGIKDDIIADRQGDKFGFQDGD